MKDCRVRQNDAMRRLWLGAAIVACALLVLVVTLSPTPVDRPIGAEITRFVDAVRALPLLGWFDYVWLERLANLVFFVPLGIVLTLALGLRWSWLVPIIAVLASTGLEVVQSLWLPERTGTIGDVIMNTIGATVGCGIGLGILAARARRRDARGA